LRDSFHALKNARATQVVLSGSKRRDTSQSIGRNLFAHKQLYQDLWMECAVPE